MLLIFSQFQYHKCCISNFSNCLNYANEVVVKPPDVLRYMQMMFWASIMIVNIHRHDAFENTTALHFSEQGFTYDTYDEALMTSASN